MQLNFIHVKRHIVLSKCTYYFSITHCNSGIINYVVKHTCGQAELTLLFSLQLLCVPEYIILKTKKKLYSKHLAIIIIESAKYKLVK